MLDLAHFLHFLSFTLGVAAMFVVYGIRKETGVTYIGSYIAVLFCINAISAAHSFESFIKIKSSLALTTVHPDQFLAVMVVLLSIVRITLALQFLRFAWKLTGRTWRSAYTHAFIGLILWVGGSQTVFILFPNSFSEPYLAASVVFCHGLLFVSFLAGVFRVFAFSQQVRKRHEGRWLRVFSWFWLAYSLLIVANRISGYADWIGLDAQLLNFAVITLLLNSLHIVFCSRFFSEYAGMRARDDSLQIDRLCRKYKISKREKEVVLLVCQGKTNKEIAEILFITPNTVRDHTSNIYRKTHVKNRTQLAGLFS